MRPIHKGTSINFYATPQGVIIATLVALTIQGVRFAAQVIALLALMPMRNIIRRLREKLRSLLVPSLRQRDVALGRGRVAAPSICASSATLACSRSCRACCAAAICASVA